MNGRLRTVVAVSVLAAGPAACSGGGDTTELPAGPAGATSPAASAARSTPAAGDQVLAAYQRFWAAVVAANKAADADMALQELGADVAGMAYVTATITVWDADPRIADEKLRLAEKIIQGRDFTAMPETPTKVSWPSAGGLAVAWVFSWFSVRS